MNPPLHAALLVPLLCVSAQSPATPSGKRPMVGTYRPTAVDQEQVLAARAFIQKNLPTLTIQEVTEAYTQVVAGLNVKLVCRVSGEDGISDWEFVAYRSLDDKWHLYGANRI